MTKTINMKKFVLSSMILSMALTGSLFALNTNQTSQATQKVVEGKEIVVSATRYPIEANKSGSSISVIPEETVKFRRPSQTAEILRGEPGVDVGVEVNNATGAQGGVTQVSIRGMPFSRTLVMVDGLRFNRPIDGIANLSDFPPLLTGNIEVLRGPQSSLYGSEAEGGVVYFRTPSGRGDPSGGASMEGGTFQFLRERAFSQGKEKKFDWNLEYSRTDTDQERPNNAFRQNAEASKFGYDFSDTARLELITRWTDYTAGTPGPKSGFGANDPDNRLMRRTTILSPQLLLNPCDIWDATIILGYIEVGQRFSSPPSEFVNHSQSVQTDFQNTIRLTDWNTLVAGVQTYSDHTTTEASSGNNVFNEASQGYYASDNFEITDRWSLLLTGRFDQHDRSRDAFTYKASQDFKLPLEDLPLDKTPILNQLPVPETHLHMSFGTGFRSPVISEVQPLFGPFSGSNAALIPERTEGYDVGIKGGLFDGKLEGDVTYFYYNVVDQIVTDQNFVFQNISEVRTEGLETSGKWIVSKALYFRQTFTLISTTAKDRRFSGNDLPRTPDYTASWTTVWSPLDNLDLSALYTYIGPSFNNASNTQELSDHHRVDLWAEYRFNPNLKMFGRIENVTGYRYQESLGFPAVGRAFIAGVECQF